MSRHCIIPGLIVGPLMLMHSAALAQRVDSLSASPAYVTTNMSVQGYLESGGVPVNDPSLQMTFRIYSDPVTGAAHSTQTISNVNVVDGTYGVKVDISEVQNQDAPLWLGIQVESDPELTPRFELTSVPYALVSKTLDLPWYGEASTEAHEGVIQIKEKGFSLGNGFFVSDASGAGMWVSTAGIGFHVNNPREKGVSVYQVGITPVAHGSNTKNGFEMAAAPGRGLWIGYTGNDGIIAYRIGNPSAIDTSAGHHGLEIGGVENNGIHIGRADDDGIYVKSAGDWAANFEGDVRVSEGSTSGVKDASLFISGNSTATHPLLYLQETTGGDYARLRFMNSDASAEPWDIAAGGTNTGRLNIWTRDKNVVSFFPDGTGTNLIETSAGVPGGAGPAGARLTQGGTWTNASSRSIKTDFRSVDARSILERLAVLPLESWRYEIEPENVRHVGPTAEDFYDAFGLGDSDRSIGTVDADGIALAAIQGLYQLAREQQEEIEAMRSEIARLKANR